jgi:uncharacterized protein (TIGR03083 family)
MTLPRVEVSGGLKDELAGFDELLRSLSEEDWRAPTRCEGWTVADVTAHVVGTMTDVSTFNLGDIGTQEGVDRTVAERKGRTPVQLADELQQAVKLADDILAGITDEAWAGPSPAPLDITLGEGVEALWYDAYMHAQDIRAAIGRGAERGPGLRASVAHLADLLTTAGWRPATLALDGIEPFDVSGGGPDITGDPLQFVLVATGREDPATIGLDETVNVYR